MPGVYFFSTMLNDQKKSLRRTIRTLKQQQPQQQKSEASQLILEKVEQSIWFQEAAIVMAYWSLDDEVQTTEWILKWHKKKRFILPCVNGKVLDLREFTGLESMKGGEKFNIMEPIGPLFTTPELIDVVIVPGIAFDTSNNRMGRGRAYYDGLLAHSKMKKIGICFDFQLLPNVPAEMHDIKMNWVITESRCTHQTIYNQ